MPRPTKTRCKYLWDPVYADVATGEYHQFSDDAVSIVEAASEMIPALGSQKALLKAFERAGWTVLLGKHSDIVTRHAGSSLARTFGDRSGEIQNLQAIVSRAIALADSWMCTCVCPEHLLLSLVELVSKGVPESTATSEVRAAIVDSLYEGKDPELEAREHLSLVLRARDGDDGALARVLRKYFAVRPDLATSHAERNLRAAIRGFSGSSPRDSHVALVRALLESELSGEENDTTQNTGEITGSSERSSKRGRD